MKRISVIYNYNMLKKRIEDEGFSQERLARKTGISRTSLNLKLNNKASFSQSEIKTVSEILGIDADELGEYFFKVNVRKTEQNE